jgi:hypothetical protein
MHTYPHLYIRKQNSNLKDLANIPHQLRELPQVCASLAASLLSPWDASQKTYSKLNENDLEVGDEDCNGKVTYRQEARMQGQGQMLD